MDCTLTSDTVCIYHVLGDECTQAGATFRTDRDGGGELVTFTQPRSKDF